VFLPILNLSPTFLHRFSPSARKRLPRSSNPRRSVDHCRAYVSLPPLNRRRYSGPSPWTSPIMSGNEGQSPPGRAFSPDYRQRRRSFDNPPRHSRYNLGMDGAADSFNSSVSFGSNLGLRWNGRQNVLEPTPPPSIIG
jgi:hypothetical protein